MTLGYWMNETGGELQPAIVAYLEQRPLSLRQIHLVKLYLAQWIDAPAWAPSPSLAALRQTVLRIETPEDIHCWLAAALDEGIDPL
jgi:hypothetical protein